MNNGMNHGMNRGMNSGAPHARGEAPAGALLRQCVAFGRLLRAGGLPVTPAHAVDLAHALTLIDAGVREDFRLCAQAVCVQQPGQRARFDELFNLFWQAREEGVQLPLRPPAQRQVRGRTAGLQDAVAAPSFTAEATTADRTATASAVEWLRQQNIAALDDAERAAVMRLLAQMRWPKPRQRRRRFVATDGRRIDLRRTVQRSFRYGGEALLLVRRRRRQAPRPLVALCDVSGSMQRYSRMLLALLYVLARQPRRVEAFVFSTRLSRITRQLRSAPIDAALDRATASVSDWGGGTRIGDALRAFNLRWAPHVLGQGAAVVIVSDGWERGDTSQLGAEMARLRRRARRVVWLNPLLGAPGYQPCVRGIQAALPYVDDFLPVYNLANLEQLTRVFADL